MVGARPARDATGESRDGATRRPGGLGGETRPPAPGMNPLFPPLDPPFGISGGSVPARPPPPRPPDTQLMYIPVSPHITPTSSKKEVWVSNSV